MTRFAFAFALAFAACDGESPSPSTEKASDLVCVASAECGGDPDPEAFCEAIRARRFNDDGSLTVEGERLLQTCAAEFEAKSACLLDNDAACDAAVACDGPCKAECDAFSFCT